MKKIYLLALWSFFLVTLSPGRDLNSRSDERSTHCILTETEIKETRRGPKQQDSTNIIVMKAAAGGMTDSGRHMVHTDSANTDQLYSENRTRAVKLHFLSPLTQHVGLAYEKSIRPGAAYEVELGVIGLGFNTREWYSLDDETNTSTGLYISLGYKLIRPPKAYVLQGKDAHILKGSYLKPQVLVSAYRNIQEEGEVPIGEVAEKTEQNILAGAIILSFGQQAVYDNTFLIDWSVGAGYGSDVDRIRNFHYGFITGINQTPFAFTARLKIGFLLK